MVVAEGPALTETAADQEAASPPRASISSSSTGALLAQIVGSAGLFLALIPPFGASGAAFAASAALTAGGAAAIVAYRSRSGFAWGSLLPRQRDLVDIVGALRGVAAGGWKTLGGTA